MTIKFFFDECLSPRLVGETVAIGHSEATCSRDWGLLQLTDAELIKYVVANDLTLVTANACDFRGAGKSRPGGLHAQQEIHAGLICLQSEQSFSLACQRRLFSEALREIAKGRELVNHALEVHEDSTGKITLRMVRPAARIAANCWGVKCIAASHSSSPVAYSAQASLSSLRSSSYVRSARSR